MAFRTSGVSSTHTYYGDAGEINFFLDDKDALVVTIDTARLHIRSVEKSEEDLDHFASLFGDQDVMKTFATGEAMSREDVRNRVHNIWAQRWHANNPYSGFAIFKKDTDDFVGHIALCPADAPGQSELGYLFMKKDWGQGYGVESSMAVVKEYAPATVKEGYKIGDETLEKINATVRPDNVASIKILEKLKMHRISEENKYGSLRYNYTIGLNEIMQKV